MAQHHGLQFEARANSSWRRREELRQLRAVAMDVVAETSDETGSVEQPVAERERRALRRVASIDRELASVNATINSFFTPAQLNAELYFLYVEQKAATYWAVVRRRHLRREAISDIPPTLQRPLWLTAADGTSALEMWNNSERKD